MNNAVRCQEQVCQLRVALCSHKFCRAVIFLCGWRWRCLSGTQPVVYSGSPPRAASIPAGCCADVATLVAVYYQRGTAPSAVSSYAAVVARHRRTNRLWVLSLWNKVICPTNDRQQPFVMLLAFPMSGQHLSSSTFLKSKDRNMSAKKYKIVGCCMLMYTPHSKPYFMVLNASLTETTNFH